MKELKIGNIKLKVCEHQGDINYLRYVRFKQLAPQFWERMDSPLFEVFFERFMEYHNKGQHAKALMTLHDYKLSIDISKESYDAWAKCFALITGFEGEDIRKSCPDETEITEKLNKLNGEGLTPDIVEREVINFMKASPGVFADHLILYGIRSGTSGIS